MGPFGSLREGWRRALPAAALGLLGLCSAAGLCAAADPPQPAQPPAVGDQVGEDEKHEPATRVDPEEAAEEAAEEREGASDIGGKSEREKRREERRARRKARREARDKEKTSGLTTDKGEGPRGFSGTLKKARTEGDSFTRPLQTLETAADESLPESASGLAGETGFSGTRRGPAEGTGSGGPGGSAGAEPVRPAPPPFSAVPSRDPANPTSVTDLVLASRSGYAPVFQAAGFKLAGDGRSIVRIADERPATEAELQRLRQGILAAPAAMAKRPDYFTVLPQAHYQELGREYGARPELKEKQFKDIEKTPDGRDFVYSASCDRMSGDCNKSVGKSSYRKGELVAPEDLEKVWGDLQEELDADAAAESAAAPSRSARPPPVGAAGPLARVRRSAGTLKDGLLDVARLLLGSPAAEPEPAGPLPLGAQRMSPAGGGAGPGSAAPDAVAAPKSLAETFRSPERKFLLLLCGVIVALGLLWRLRD